MLAISHGIITADDVLNQFKSFKGLVGPKTPKKKKNDIENLDNSRLNMSKDNLLDSESPKKTRKSIMPFTVKDLLKRSK